MSVPEDAMRRAAFALLLVFAPAAAAQTARPAPKRRPPVTPAAVIHVDSGDVDRLTALDIAIRRHSGELRFCYEQAGLKHNPTLTGTLTLTLRLAADGAVAQAQPLSSEWSGAEGVLVDHCIFRRVREWKFEAEVGAAGAGPHEYAFTFTR